MISAIPRELEIFDSLLNVQSFARFVRIVQTMMKNAIFNVLTSRDEPYFTKILVFSFSAMNQKNFLYLIHIFSRIRT